MRALIAVAVVLACVGALPRARAESAPPRDAGPTCFYGTPEIDPPAGTIPASQPLFVVALTGTAISGSARLTRMRDGYVVPLEDLTHTGFVGGVVLAPRELLSVGDTYVLDHPRCGMLAPRSTVYEVTDPIPGPASAGTIRVLGPYAAYFAHGACNRGAFFDVVLTPDPAFASAPWSEFSWGADVYGAPTQPRATPMTTTTLRTFVGCGGTYGVTEGHHDVRAVVVPLAEESPTPWAAFASATVPIDIDCATLAVVDPVTLVPLTPGEIASWASDPAGLCGMDGGGHTMDASVDPTHAMPASCGCRAGGHQRGGWIAAVLGLALTRVRRRRARSASRRPSTSQSTRSSSSPAR